MAADKRKSSRKKLAKGKKLQATKPLMSLNYTQTQTTYKPQ